MNLFFNKNIWLLLLGLLYCQNIFAVEPQEFCKFMLKRAQRKPVTTALNGDNAKKLEDLKEIMRKNQAFLDIAKQGVDQKMTWEDFKKFSATKKLILGDSFQAQYDEMYLLKYCGTPNRTVTEAGLDIPGGLPVERTAVSFPLKPDPAAHPYSKQIPATK